MQNTDLQNDVIDAWEKEGVAYFTTENNGFNAPDPEHWETTIKPEYQDILDSPELCRQELLKLQEIAWT